jgi:hypothetical protein
MVQKSIGGLPLSVRWLHSLKEMASWNESNIAQQYLRRKQSAERGCVCLNDILKNTYHVLQKLQKAADPTLSTTDREECVTQLHHARNAIKESMANLIGSIDVIEDSKVQVEEVFRSGVQGSVPALPDTVRLQREKEQLQQQVAQKDEQIRNAMILLRELQSDLAIMLN